VFTPNHEYNMGGDVIGIFRSAEDEKRFVLIIIQAKNWFKESLAVSSVNNYSNSSSSSSILIGHQWRKSQEEFPKSIKGFGTDIIVAKGRKSTSGKNLGFCSKVSRVFILCTGNELQTAISCAADEGIVTIRAMRSWLPTAAYNCEAAHHLRQMFTANDSVEDAEQGFDDEASGDEVEDDEEKEGDAEEDEGDNIN